MTITDFLAVAIIVFILGIVGGALIDLLSETMGKEEERNDA